MDTIVKEYGSFLATIIGALFGFAMLTLCVFSFKDQSRMMIAQMTGVSYDNLQYVTAGGTP